MDQRATGGAGDAGDREIAAAGDRGATQAGTSSDGGTGTPVGAGGTAELSRFGPGDLDYSAAHASPVGVPGEPTSTAIGRRGIGRSLRGGAEGALRQTGGALRRAAENLRSAGAEDPRRERAAAVLTRGGDYLESPSPETIRRDVEGAIRTRPLAAVLVGLGVGVALGMLGRRSSR